MRDALGTLFGQKLPAPMEGAIEKLFLLDRLEEVYQQIRETLGDANFFERVLETLNVRSMVSESDLARVPREGPVVAVANHPFGLIEGMVIGAVLPAVRPDMKMMTNFLLSRFEEARDRLITVDPFGGPEATRSNLRGIKETISYLKNGGLVVVFPAGEVAHLNLKEREITDPEWSPTIARIVRTTGASVLPLYFKGANSAMFQLLALLHPRMRTALLLHEFFNKQDGEIELRIGNLIPPKKLQGYQDDVSLIRYLRHRTYLLQDREPTVTGKKPDVAATAAVPVIGPVPSSLLAAEVASLAPEHLLAESGEFLVMLARAHEVPHILREIGRLREVMFRAAGEGTGLALDLDDFDRHYLHLFLWNRDQAEIAGAYRLGPSDEIVEQHGKQGLYTNQLFAYKREFLERIQPALEMGRSFVRLEYQRSYAPLLLLWKGIAAFVAKNQKYKVLFGPVSISNEYNPASRQLIVSFLKTYSQAPGLAPLVRARSPFKQKPHSRFSRELAGAVVWDIEELSMMVADIETDQKGVPILLKQYLKLGGKLVGFNVDAHFANALDGLIVVDLTQTDPRVLERYMGKKGAAEFLQFWAREAVPA
jgi:putative hemolysin